MLILKGDSNFLLSFCLLEFDKIVNIGFIEAIFINKNIIVYKYRLLDKNSLFTKSFSIPVKGGKPDIIIKQIIYINVIAGFSFHCISFMSSVLDILQRYDEDINISAGIIDEDIMQYMEKILFCNIPAVTIDVFAIHRQPVIFIIFD